MIDQSRSVHLTRGNIRFPIIDSESFEKVISLDVPFSPAERRREDQENHRSSQSIGAAHSMMLPCLVIVSGRVWRIRFWRDELSIDLQKEGIPSMFTPSCCPSIPRLSNMCFHQVGTSCSLIVLVLQRRCSQHLILRSEILECFELSWKEFTFILLCWWLAIDIFKHIA